MYTYKKQDRNITNSYDRIINVEKNGLKEIQKAFGKTLGLQTLLFSRDKLLLFKKKKKFGKFIEKLKMQFNESASLKTPDSESLPD